MTIRSSSFKMISGRILSIMISFVTGVILARYLGAEDRGYLSIYLITIGFVVLILNAGIAESSIYLLNNGEEDRNQVVKNQIFYLFNIALIFSIAAILLIPYIVIEREQDLYCLLPIVVLMLFNSLFRHYLLADKKIGNYTSSVIFENSSLLVLVFITAFFKFSFIYILLSNLISQIIVFGYMVRKLKFKLPKLQLPLVNLLYIKKSYAFGLHLFFTGIGGFGLQRIGFYILGYLSGPRSVGLYTVGSIIPSIYENLPQQISSIAFTYVAGEKDIFKRKMIALSIVKFVFYALVFAAIPLFIFVDEIIILVFGTEFRNLGLLTSLLTISTIFSGLSGLFYNFLAGIGKPRFGTYLTILNLSVTIVASGLFIFYFGLIGAAWAKLISSIISTIYIGYLFLFHYNIKLTEVLSIRKSELNTLFSIIKRWDFK